MFLQNTANRYGKFKRIFKLISRNQTDNDNELFNFI